VVGFKSGRTMIDERPDKDRVKCPRCGAFLMEVKPRLNAGQVVVCYCPKCRNEVTVKK
jgi:uncharacterized paraquat-inducible protein A